MADIGDTIIINAPHVYEGCMGYVAGKPGPATVLVMLLRVTGVEFGTVAASVDRVTVMVDDEHTLYDIADPATQLKEWQDGTRCRCNRRCTAFGVRQDKEA